MNTDLIFISLEHWDDVWRRNQFVCAELARRHPTRTILFVTPPRDLTNALRRGQFSRMRQMPNWSPDGLPNIVVSTPTKWWPNSIGFGRAINEAALRGHVVRESQRLRQERPLLWINDHTAAHLAGHVEAVATIYDVTDDWISFDQPSAVRERIRTQDARLCRMADATIVCSERLFEMKTQLTRRLHLVRNGVDADHYRNVLDAGGAKPAESLRWERPVLGYTGSIHPDRVDVDLVEAIARTIGSGTVALVGPDMLPSEQRARLVATGRVVLTGPVPYRSIPDWMRAFDVCITPHRVTPFTESLNPLKLWEYLASGKPIVSTPVAGFRDYPVYVRLASDADTFIAAIAVALAEPPDLAERRRCEARQHTWGVRVDQIEAIIAQCMEAASEPVSSGYAGARHE